jgi:hypothetical protein
MATYRDLERELKHLLTPDEIATTHAQAVQEGKSVSQLICDTAAESLGRPQGSVSLDEVVGAYKIARFLRKA